jgi:chitin disaccharide deacetylase
VSRVLIFNADDYGLSPAVCRGILTSAQGVVRSTTVMANFVRADDALGLEGSALSAGAHLNISAGLPLTKYYPHALLTDDGRFNKNLALMDFTWESQPFRNAVLSEWQAQLDRLKELGIKLTHLDSHHHTHLLKPLFPIAATLARRHGLALRARTPEQRALARREGVRSPDSLIEGFFGAESISRERLLGLLAQAEGEVVEVMCHPGKLDGLLRERSGYFSEREQELALLGDPALAEELCDAGWRLLGFGW